MQIEVNDGVTRRGLVMRDLLVNSYCQMVRDNPEVFRQISGEASHLFELAIQIMEEPPLVDHTEEEVEEIVQRVSEGITKMVEQAKERMATEVPYLTISNEELAEKPDLGDTIDCPHCDEDHEVVTQGEPGLQIHVFKCQDQTYMAGLNGKRTAPERSAT